LHSVLYAILFPIGASMSGKPPFRADQVGSLLRPLEIKQAWVDLDAGRITPDELTAIENAAVDRVVAKQEAAGLKSVTDGEIRRHTWLGDFLLGLDGTVAKPMEIKAADQTTATIEIPIVNGKIGFSGHPMLEHFRYLAAHTNVTPKMTIPAPAMLVSALRDWRQVVDSDVYPEIGELYHDLGLAYRDVVAAFYAAGCRYLQLDDVNLAYLCDPTARGRIEARGDDPDALLETWVETVNTAIAGRPHDMIVTTHICRGNFRSTWLAEGGYEPVAEVLFNRYDYNGYFLEYDSDRAGGFEPLRFVPDGDKFVVLGLVTTKTGTLEDPDTIKARVEAASRYVPLDRLCLSPQCGFASTEEGNIITEDEQWAKLAHVAEIAAEIWPDA
jgi:5-methyltetrahydropteroyltriglutamate--homocysteine methyltransferase